VVRAVRVVASITSTVAVAAARDTRRTKTGTPTLYCQPPLLTKHLLKVFTIWLPHQQLPLSRLVPHLPSHPLLLPRPHLPLLQHVHLLPMQILSALASMLPLPLVLLPGYSFNYPFFFLKKKTHKKNITLRFSLVSCFFNLITYRL
jgi:hypothetical protein